MSAAAISRDSKIVIPAIAEGPAQLFAAAFRAVGFDAEVTPTSNGRTLELGARCTDGDECFPVQVTTGDFLRTLERPAMDPSRTVLFMPLADGPCRFGQYASCLRTVLDAKGYQQVGILSPSSEDGYTGLQGQARPFLRTAWRALVAADILEKRRLMTRPYELKPGDADRAHQESLRDLSETIESGPLGPACQMRVLGDAMVRCRDRFRGVKCRSRERPLIGIVGEMFCRLNAFSNQDLVRRIEQYGGEAWIVGLTDWVWYSNWQELRSLKLRGRLFSRQALAGYLRGRAQRRDEGALREPFADDFRGREEPRIGEVLDAARPYLPPEGALGEMVASIGHTVCFARRGVDGVIDISPFSCMNGIVSEAIYRRVSTDLGGLPIRSLYFDGSSTDLDLDLGILLEMASAYHRRAVQAIP